MTVAATADPEPLICGFAVTGDTVHTLPWDELKKGTAAKDGERRWLHINRRSAAAKAWLLDEVSVDYIAVNVLFQEDARPRAVVHKDGLLVNLRGVNLNPGAQPEDMVSLRIWMTENLVITTQNRPILATWNLKATFESGSPPPSSGAIVVFLAGRLTDRLEPVLDRLEDEVDALEERLLDDNAAPPKSELAKFRRQALQLRRYVLPQREAISSLLREQINLLGDDDRLSLRENQDTVIRLAEDLDNIRERALVLQEQIVESRAEAMNQRLFVLAIISAVFLPLGFVTGLFGVNVGGMPGVGSPLAFTLLCLGLIGVCIGLLILFRRMKWL